MTDRLDLLGKQVTWTDGMGGKHDGQAVAYSDGPTYLLDLDDGRRLVVNPHSVEAKEEA